MGGAAISFPPVSDASRPAVVEFLARYRSVCEVGVGRRPGVAAALADRGVDARATDVAPRDVPDSVRFVVDDVVDAAARDDPGDVYRVDAVYALNCPPELHRPLLAVARAVDAACLFTTLGGDPAAVPATPVTVPGDTVYVARDPDGRAAGGADESERP